MVRKGETGNVNVICGTIQADLVREYTDPALLTFLDRRISHLSELWLEDEFIFSHGMKISI